MERKYKGTSRIDMLKTLLKIKVEQMRIIAAIHLILMNHLENNT
jgi:hypothetical protein